MKTIHIDDETHDRLRIKSIHEKKKLGVLANELLSNSLTPTTFKGK